MGDIDALPQELMEKIVSRTSPVDAGGSLSIVSKSFQSAAISDKVWSTFLPVDLISRRTPLHSLPNPKFDDPWNKIDSNTLQAFPTKKDLYLFLSDNPLIIEDGAMCFWLDKFSGTRCFYILPETLSISEPDQLTKIYYQESRFDYAPELFCVEHLEINGKMNTTLLSPDTAYTAYLLFHFSNSYFGGFGEEQPLEAYVGIDGVCESEWRIVYIPWMLTKYHYIDGPNGPKLEWKSDLPVLSGSQYPQVRKENKYLYQIELGDYFNKEGTGVNKELKMCLREVKSGIRKSGISILGIEIRPRSCKTFMGPW